MKLFPALASLYGFVLAWAFLIAGCATQATSKVEGSKTEQQRDVQQSGPNSAWQDEYQIRIGVPGYQLPSTQPAPTKGKR